MTKGGNKQNNLLKRVQKSEENEENIVPKIDILPNEAYNDEKTNSTVGEKEITDGSKSTNRTIKDMDEMFTEDHLMQKEIQSARCSR